MKHILLLAIVFAGMMNKTDCQLDGRNENIPLFSFGVFADAQYCDCDPEGSRFYRNSPEKLDNALEIMVAEKPAFIFNLGDLIEKDFASFAPMISIIESHLTKVVFCPGNHDYSVDRKHFRKLPFTSDGTPGYFSFAHDNFRFIILNGNELSTYGPGRNRERKQASIMLEQMKSEGKPNAMQWNGGLSGEQLKWLDNELMKAKENDEKVFILCHFPVWPVTSHVLLNQEEVLGILGSYDNIIAWFAGHDHRGGYGNFNLIHCVTFRGMVETADENSFAIVDVYKNKIWIRGFGREKSRILAY